MLTPGQTAQESPNRIIIYIPPARLRLRPATLIRSPTGHVGSTWRWTIPGSCKKDCGRTAPMLAPARVGRTAPRHVHALLTIGSNEWVMHSKLKSAAGMVLGRPGQASENHRLDEPRLKSQSVGREHGLQGTAPPGCRFGGCFKSAKRGYDTAAKSVQSNGPHTPALQSPGRDCHCPSKLSNNASQRSCDGRFPRLCRMSHKAQVGRTAPNTRSPNRQK